MDRIFLKRLIEALIFASDSPLTIKDLQTAIDEVSLEETEEAVKVIHEEYSNGNYGFFLKKVAGGYTFATKPEYYKWIKQLFEGKIQSRLSQAALEALAIITYKQPVSKIEVSTIRGVNSDGVIKNLLLRKLITIVGRSTGPGRPLLYGTTPEFLRYFGLNSLNDLPKPREIEELLSDGEGATLLSNLEKDNEDHNHREDENNNRGSTEQDTHDDDDNLNNDST